MAMELRRSSSFFARSGHKSSRHPALDPVSRRRLADPIWIGDPYRERRLTPLTSPASSALLDLTEEGQSRGMAGSMQAADAAGRISRCCRCSCCAGSSPYQIQVQRELCAQLEVQKKLQMRIEAQVRYLKEILEKAQENISFDANGSAGLENARSQLTDFNRALPGLSNNGTHVYEESTEQPVKAISDGNLHDNNLDFQLYRVRSQEAKNAKCTLKIEDLLLLDLNIKGGYDLSMRGMQG
ncbi:hypothetical protein ZWY2020_032317 [Hordeum vulgare]|nr:hypothetical protein ZWY2020_032317 [Hordeum vulgare]